MIVLAVNPIMVLHLAIMVLHCFRIRPGIPSGPVTLDISKLHRCVATSFSEMVMSDSWEEEVTKEMNASWFMAV